MVQAWDLWTSNQQRQFNPDGTLKDRDRMLENGMHGVVYSLESRMKEDIESFERTEKTWQEKYGCSFGEWKLKGRREAAQYNAQRRKQVIKDIKNGEDISELSIHVDVDDYYRIQAGENVNLGEDF